MMCDTRVLGSLVVLLTRCIQVDKCKIVEMISQQGERVPLTAPVEAKGTECCCTVVVNP